MMQLMHTDLPEPVVPETSRWGILLISNMTGRPDTSQPRQAVMRLLAFRNSGVSSRLRR